jgi:ATP-binding cassette subfamily F protein uup
MAVDKPVLQVDGLTKLIGARVLFDNISFGIAEGKRVGLIAQNGTGKSTLLGILCDEEPYDAGSVVFRKDLEVGYLRQSPSYPADFTVLEACFYHGNSTTSLIKEYEACLNTPGHPGLTELMERMECEQAWDYEQRAKQVLSQLKITDFDQRIGELSGGQLKRVALANVLILAPDLLILDEPTNHLDLEMIEWLERYLAKSNLTLLMVTHDRYFLDRVCSEILELDNCSMYSYKGNYEYFLEKRQERVDAKQAEIARANNLYRTELDWMRRMPCARGHKARYREEAFFELEKVAKQRTTDRKVTLEVKSEYIGNKIFEADYLCKSFGDRVILKDFYYNFSRYEKMGVVGNNGTGKSTFIKMLLGLVKPDSGKIVVGETVRFGYYSQEGLQFDEQTKVIDVVRKYAEYIDLGGGRKMSAMQFLQHFLFTPQEQQSYVYKLSGGERRRLYLCTVLMQNPNFLVLDEPTNDLDIVTLQILEEYLRNFKGCVIVVSHDRYFMDKVVDHLLVFQGQGDIRDFPGNYSQYREWQEEKERREREAAAGRTAVAAAQGTPKQKGAERTDGRTHEEKNRLTYMEKKEFAALTTEIEALETEKKEIETQLCGGTQSVEEITAQSKRLAQINDALEEKELRWLELSEKTE